MKLGTFSNFAFFSLAMEEGFNYQAWWEEEDIYLLDYNFIVELIILI